MRSIFRIRHSSCILVLGMTLSCVYSAPLDSRVGRCKVTTTRLAFVDPTGRKVIEHFINQSQINRLAQLYIRYKYVQKELSLGKPTDPEETLESLRAESDKLKEVILPFVLLIKEVQFRGDQYLMERFKNCDPDLLRKDVLRITEGKIPHTAPVRARQALNDSEYLYELELKAYMAAKALALYDQGINGPP